MINPFNYFFLQDSIPRYPTWEKDIHFLEDPEYVVIPLEYPGRILYKPTIKIGEQVYQKQIIGRSSLGHCIHASVSGVVKDILAIWSAKSFHVPAILIHRNDKKAISVQEIFEQAGFAFESTNPVDKLKILGVISPWNRPGRWQEEADKSFPEVKKIVIKGLDEEPSIFLNGLIIQNYTIKISRGLSYLSNLAHRAEIILAVSNHNRTWATDQFGSLAKVQGIGQNYKDRISQLMVSKLTETNIPTISAYRTHGIAVLSAEYLLNLVDALDGKSPFIHKFLTVAGSEMNEPKTIKIPIGMTIRQVLKALNISDKTFGRILVGGPMQGIAQYTDLTPLTKTSHGLYLMGQQELPLETNLTCTSCGRCTRMCPVNLQVHLVGRYAEYGMFTDTTAYHTEACVECGLCGFVCPAHRPLIQLIQMCKKYCGITNEYPQQQAECGATSALERWELNFQNAASLDSGASAGNTHESVAVRT
jgi:electron transport complex protein RnfC